MLEVPTETRNRRHDIGHGGLRWQRVLRLHAQHSEFVAIEPERLLSTEERRQLRAIVEYLKPAHTHLVDLVEPLPIVEPEHWELGISELGVETELH